MGDRPEIELSGIHVLVIDDDRLTRHFLGSVLESSGAIVTERSKRESILEHDSPKGSVSWPLRSR
jgi:CheY-like chemotaxis protein